MTPKRLRKLRMGRVARRAERKFAPPVIKPELPTVAPDADNLKEIKKAVDDAASVSGGLWLSYLFVLFYIAMAAGAVTHEDLLLQRPVKLPFLNIELSLLAFFFLAPFLFLITHTYALLHFIMLGKKASYFSAQLKSQVPDPKERDKSRRLLPSNIFVQILAGPPDLRKGLFGTMLKIMGWTTLVLFPILLLLLLQIQFLPYHDGTITWAQRIALCLDIVLVWVFRLPILSSGDDPGARAARWFYFTVGGVMSLAAIWLSIAVATIPGEPTAFSAEDRPFWQTFADWNGWTRDQLFAGDVDTTTRRRKSLFSNTLVLPGFNIFEALKIDDPEKLQRKTHLFDLRGRHLEQAGLQGADLTKVDLTGVWLQDGKLDLARLQGASFNEAHLQGASFDEAQLQGANFERAQLWGAKLGGARLQRARLDGAQLDDAWLVRAQLQGAWLYDARLKRALLDSAELQGAFLELAQLQGASLLAGQLQGADLNGAGLEGAWLQGAQLQGASLSGASLQGADLVGAELQGADLQDARLQGASLVGAQLLGASLSRAITMATDLSHSSLWRTDWQKGYLSQAAAIRLHGAKWKPEFTRSLPGFETVAWTGKSYGDLQRSLRSLPEGKMREMALQRIRTLDCDDHHEKLAACDPAATPPREVKDWQQMLKRATVNDRSYQKALASTLRDLICTDHRNAIPIVRGLTNNGRLKATGPEAPALVDFIMSKDCPLAAAFTDDDLTDDDKAQLLNIKQDAEKEFPPSSPPKKGQ